MQYLKVSYQGDTLGKQHIVLIFDMFIEWPLLYVGLYTVLIEVSLSDPHTSETALCMHMCMLAHVYACLLVATYHKFQLSAF